METLGVVETYHIASGVRLLDLMLKAADVYLVKGCAICSGRFMIQLAGDRAAVEVCLAAAREAGVSLAASHIISNISTQVVNALQRQSPLPQGCALGVIEARKAVPGIVAADAAVKRAAVTIGRLTLATGINGKSYLVLGGTVDAVQEAVAAAAESLGKELVEVTVLPQPDPQVAEALVPTTRTTQFL